MNSFWSRKGMDLQDSFPRCMGRMINLFDLSAGMARTELLTERPHGDVVRNCCDVVKEPIQPVVAEIEGKQIVSEQRSSSPNKKSSVTPIKMLISQEMWGDMESRQKRPSVIARLMGLDSLPVQQSGINDKRGRNQDCLCNSLTGELWHYQQQEDDYVGNSVACESQSFTHEKKVFRDVYEVRQQPQKNVCLKEQSPQKSRYYENSHQRRMALVRQKFIEAKRLATDEKLIDSKEFQDAVEVLNSNRDLFLKFLEEPNSMFTKHLFELPSIPLPSQKTRITVLKPSSTTEKRGEKSMERQLLTDSAEIVGKANNHYWSSGFSEPKVQNLSQPTRIVVLKPSPGKPVDIKTTLPNNSPTLLGAQVSSEAPATDELVGSREVAKEITHQMRESRSSNRDESLLSSVLSNGYIGDESSFNRSESECMEDEVDSISDSEIATPATDYSWDCINKIGSPFSASFCTRASHSPESSVIKEAKKRLSERLALVASNENSQEQRQLRRTSSTLGEMLAIPEFKKEGSTEELTLSSSRSSNGEDDLKVPSAFSSTFGTKDEHVGENSYRNLSRSKSVPRSSSACEVNEPNVGISSSLIVKPIVQTEVRNSNSGRSSFKDKVSSFFFSRSKKSGGGKPSRSPPVHDDRLESGNSDGSDKINDNLLQSVDDTLLAQTTVVSPDKLHDRTTKGILYPKGAFSLEKPGISGHFAQNQGRFSQISVVEAPLADDVNNGIIAGCPQALSRSPPIESVARSLSWGASYLDSALAKPLKSCMIFSKADKEHEQCVFVHKLMSSAGIDDRKSMIFGRWHSLDSPLNPSLLYESLHVDEEDAKCRQRSSSRRLLFDAVNVSILDISRSALFAAHPGTGAASHEAWKDDAAGTSAAEEVWALVRKGLSSMKCVPVPSEFSSSSNIVVDRLVKEEVAGRQWDESRWLEVCEAGKEIDGKVLEELIEEALSELSFKSS